MNRLTHFIKSKIYGGTFPVVKAQTNAKSVVLILGFGGAENKNFRRLLEHYEERNVSTVLFTMPLVLPMFIRNSFMNDVEDMVNNQLELIGKNRSSSSSSSSSSNSSSSSSETGPKLSMHIYSNNGSWLFSNLVKNGKLKPDQIIFDSAPHFIYKRDIPFEATVLSQLFTSVHYKGAEYYRFPMTPIVKFGATLVLLQSSLTDFLFPFKYNYFANYYGMHAYLRDNCPSVPTLFIGSTGDLLVPPAKIREFKAVLDARGVPTQEYLFGDDVPHIASIYVHPVEYKQVVDKFLGLGESSGNDSSSAAISQGKNSSGK